MTLHRSLILLAAAAVSSAQVYSPSVLMNGQPDPTDLKRLAAGIYRQAHAETPRQRAEAIWRYFLTDGRFVKPGFFYHIAGWAYEEPVGEVLDPVKLLNSYGFGLCYHIAPLLEAVFEAGGFEDARVWFLTGHTVAEVYYDGAYHYFDSDMMGYNVAGGGPFAGKPVSSVRELERDRSILLGKLAAPNKVKPGVVDDPWYPADVRESAIDGLSSLFTTTEDNYLFPHTRYARGHDMSHVLRPGEKIVRYFQPEQRRLYYLPYAFNGDVWKEFAREVAAYRIRTADGPRSQKDERSWATGRIEYVPPRIPSTGVLVYDMPSPWVVIDAAFRIKLRMPSSASSLRVETSLDGSKWDVAAELLGPYTGEWAIEPRVILKTANGRHTVVSGAYGYKVRITRGGPPTVLESIALTTRFQLNPRTLPSLMPGSNALTYTSGAPVQRIGVPIALDRIPARDLKYVEEKGQGMLRPVSEAGEAIIELAAEGRLLAGFDAGARFLTLKGGLAPDKLTAETRTTAVATNAGETSIEWALSASGPWRRLWTSTPPAWRDNDRIDRTLDWPESFASIRDLPAGTKRVFVRFRSGGPCIDNLRLAVYAHAQPPQGRLRITHAWSENGKHREHREEIGATAAHHSYRIDTGAALKNESISFELLR